MKSHRPMTTKMPPWPPAINWPELCLIVVKIPLQAERSRDLDCWEILNSSGSKPLWSCKLNPSNGCCHDGGGGETSRRRENGGSKLVMHFSLRNNQNTLQIFADTQHSLFSCNLFPQLALGPSTILIVKYLYVKLAFWSLTTRTFKSCSNRPPTYLYGDIKIIKPSFYFG